MRDVHELVDRCTECAGRVADRAGEVAARARALVTAAMRMVLRGVRREPLPCRPLVVVAASVAAGCVAGPGIAGLVPAGTAAGVAVGCWGVAAAAHAAWAWLARSARHAPAAVALIVAIAATAAGWAVARDRLFRLDDLAWTLTETPAPVAIEGVVIASPRLLAPATGPEPGVAPASECIVSVSRVRRGAGWKPASGRAAVVVAGEPPRVVAGSRVRIVGRGLRPASALNPGEIDSRVRARSDRCLSVVRCRSGECIRVLAAPAAWSAAAALDRMQIAGVAALERHVPHRSALAAALLLGSRQALPGDESREFMVTGTIHILSISGLHVGILAFGLFKLLGAATVPRVRSLAAVAILTGLYMLLVGAETPVVRATLIVWLSCLGAAAGRRSPALNALAVAAIVVLAWHPPEIFHIGTQLSFLSTAVLVGAGALGPAARPTTDPIDRLIERSRSPLERRLRRLGRHALGAVVAGGAIWVVTAPLVAARFHVVSPIGLVLNPVVAPLVPLAMACGFLCLLAAPFSDGLAGPCGAGCDAALALVEWLVRRAGSLPGAYAWVAGPEAWWVAGAYALLVGMLLALPRERLVRLRTWAIAAAAWSMVGMLSAGSRAAVAPRAAPLEVTIASLGHGCGVVVRSPAGRVVVYDAGRLGAPGAALRGISAVLWSAGTSRIDTLVLSHADTDHFNAVPALLERFSVGEIVVSEAFLGSGSIAVRDLLERVRERRIAIRRVVAGDEIPCDPLCRVRVLHGDTASAEDNQTSLVVSVEAAGRRLLLTGDLDGESLARFIAADPDCCDVIMAPHHGSITSLPPDIAAATRPDWVVVSGPGGSRWPEVERAYAAARGAGGAARVVKTAGPADAGGAAGAVRLSLSAAGVSVRQFSAGRWRDVAPGRGPPRPPRAL